MDELNLNFLMEQVNQNVGSNFLKWEENHEDALNNVVDPNTEFNNDKLGNLTSSPTSPSQSYALEDNLESTIVRPKEFTRQHSDSNSLFFQLNEGVSFESNNKRVVVDESGIAQVHMYSSTTAPMAEHLQSPGNRNVTHHENPRVSLSRKLIKYPPERITILTEKRTHLPTFSDDNNRVNIVQKQEQANQEDQRVKIIPANTGAFEESPNQSITSSRESVATHSIASGKLGGAASVSSLNNLVPNVNYGCDTSSTTADQLAWAFRAANNRMETASNMSGCSSRFELESNYSERGETMSTISDVSGYEEEMFRIKRLLLMDPAGSVAPKSSVKIMNDENVQNGTQKLNCFNDDTYNRSYRPVISSENVDVRIHGLNIQLQNALSEKDKFRMECMEVETRASLEWQGKYREALRQKAHTDGQLETVECELQQARQEMTANILAWEEESKLRNSTESRVILQEMERLTSENTTLQQKMRAAENRHQELATKLDQEEVELNRQRRELDTTEMENEKLRIQVQELRVEMDTKDGSIQGLKGKVADQHVELQSLLQAKLRAENSLTSVKNEMESVRTSGHWYRDQLHACQAAKVKVQQELMTSQASLVSHSHLVEKLKGQVAGLRHESAEVQQRTVREKETLMRRLEVIQADMMERETAMLGQGNITTETAMVTAKLKRMEEEKQRISIVSSVSLQDLTQQMTVLRNELKGRDSAIQEMEAEHSQIMVRVTTLQKTLNAKELSLQSVENRCKDAEMVHTQIAETLKAKEQMLLEIRNEKVAMEVSIVAGAKEKLEVDLAIEKLREDFARVTNHYQTMKIELRDRERQVEILEQTVRDLEKLNRHQDSQKKELDQVSEECVSLRKRILGVELWERKVEQLTSINLELSNKITELTETHKYLQGKSLKLEESLVYREEQLMNQTRSFDVHREEMQAQEGHMQHLQLKKQALEADKKMLSLKVKELEAVIGKLTLKVESSEQQLIRSNGAIEQFNVLCRRSEEEKFKLDIQLKNALKDTERIKNSMNQLSLPVHVDASPPTNSKAMNVEDSNINIQSQPEDKISSDKVASAISNGNLQRNLECLRKLVDQSELHIIALLSKNEPSIARQQESAGTNVKKYDFHNILEKITALNNSLVEVIKLKEHLVEDVQRERQKKESERELKNNETCLSDSVLTNSSKMHSSTKVSTQTNELQVATSVMQTTLENTKYEEELQLNQKEISRLKGSVRMLDIENREKHRRYQQNVRTLLKKVKEHMRGRKTAERKLQELQGGVSREDVKTRQLELELQASQRKYDELKKVLQETEEAMLKLEKEVGKLTHIQGSTRDRPSAILRDEGNDDLDRKALMMQLQQGQVRTVELEQQVHKCNIIIRELRKEIHNEKCESSQLRKQLASLRLGLDTANEVIDNKKVELGRCESMCEAYRDFNARLQRELEAEQLAHEDSKDVAERLQGELEETRAKDPVLVDQIKSLSYHLHQKNQETVGLQEKIHLLDQRWVSTESSLQESINSLQKELASLRSEVDMVRAEKFSLQTQAAELRAALQSSSEHNKVLRLKLESIGSENKDKLPDLTLSLPSAPTRYDETKILQLLQQSTVLPRSKPLNNLQCCLDSLKLEMATLQKQLVAKTSPTKMTEIDNQVQNI